MFGPPGVLPMLRNQQDMYTGLYDDPDAVKNTAREITIMSKNMWMETEGPLVKKLADLVHERSCPVLIAASASISMRQLK